MKRRKLLKKIMSGGAALSGAILMPGLASTSCKNQSVTSSAIFGEIAGNTLQELADNYRERIFRQYLPFWEKGGYDKVNGGFMCELNDDGSVVNDEKYIWYQGRAIWVYSYLYNNISREDKYLETAKKTRDFLVKKMYKGNGMWHESVNREGTPIESTVSQGSSTDIYGAMFSAAGLIELFKATGDKEDLEIALTSIKSSVDLYESSDYEGVTVPGINQKGLRTLGHSFMFIWTLTNLLSFYSDSELEKLQNEHVNHVINDFWNPEFRINNENLFHDYTRLPGTESTMYSGHYLETLWMLLHEALRRKDSDLFEMIKNRAKHLIEMTWDYVFEGMGTEDYHVFSYDGKCLGPEFDLKVMWAHTEVLITTMTIMECTGEQWAKDWYERTREYCLKHFANTGTGVWRQAVDRYGNDKQRPGISIYRKDNFHQIRYQMMNLLSIERMIRKMNDNGTA